MRRWFYALVGGIGWALAILPMVALAGFLAGIEPPWDVAAVLPAGPDPALAVDLSLLLSFAFVHSLLARPVGKRALRRLVPAALERSVYSAIAGVQILLVLVLWQPLPEPVWSLASAAARGLAWSAFALGWGVVLAALAAVDSGHLFGFRQALAGARGEEAPEPPMVARGPYRWIRHPLYSGTIVALFATPEMSRGHLLLASVFTLYIFVGAWFEERELVRRHGESYLAYRGRVPGYVPRLLPRSRAARVTAPGP